MRFVFGGIIDAIRSLAIACRQPCLWVRVVTKESDMALVYAVTAGQPVDSDVVARELTVVVDGAVVSTESFNGDETDLGEIKVPQDSSVVLTLIDIDDANNRSQPATVEFKATDTIAPAAPGSFGVTLSREE